MKAWRYPYITSLPSMLPSNLSRTRYPQRWPRLDHPTPFTFAPDVVRGAGLHRRHTIWSVSRYWHFQQNESALGTAARKSLRAFFHPHRIGSPHRVGNAHVNFHKKLNPTVGALDRLPCWVVCRQAIGEIRTSLLSLDKVHPAR